MIDNQSIIALAIVDSPAWKINEEVISEPEVLDLEPKELRTFNFYPIIQFQWLPIVFTLIETEWIETLYLK